MDRVTTPTILERSSRITTSRVFAQTPSPSRSASFSSSWSFRTVASASSTDSSAFWTTPPKRWQTSFLGWTFRLPTESHMRRYVSKRRAVFLVLLALLSIFYFLPAGSLGERNVVRVQSVQLFESTYEPILPAIPPPSKKSPDPVRWLAENSGDKHAASNPLSQLPRIGSYGRPRAALISLVRNSELEGIMQSMRQLEYRWNRKYQYPWVFFNDEPFSEEFKAGTRNLTTAKCFYEVVPKEHWELPEWIDEDRFENGLEYLGTIGVGKGWMVSYHHMCRWNAGFFYKHPFLKDFDWYWRIEPDVHYFCDIDYDVFRFMRDNNMKYGFNMNILDDARSFPSLWTSTQEFINTHHNLIHSEADLAWLLDPRANNEYNNCQFFSNFEIGSLGFWRSEANEAYFNWLDKAGGFYYERFGDAPVHTLSISMFVPKSEIWYFNDIGYQHDINHHCPKKEDMCSCEPTPMDANFYKLVPWESPQKKPDDTCLRLWLGGEWLAKKEGWTREGEKAFGGDGYHGYLREG